MEPWEVVREAFTAGIVVQRRRRRHKGKGVAFLIENRTLRAG